MSDGGSGDSHTRRRRRLALLLVTMAAASFETRDAHASEPESIVLRYEAGAACPSESAFVDRVRAYTTRWSRVPTDAGGVRSIRVRANARAHESSARGQLTVTGTDGEATERTLSAPNCDALAEALAIMVAVAIDPSALTAHETEPSPAPTEEAPRETESLPLLVTTPPTEAARNEMPKPIVGEPHPSVRLRMSAALRGAVTSTVIDTALPVGELAIAIEGSFERLPAWVRPSLSVGLRRSLPTDVSLRGGTIEFLWTAANVRLCPLGSSTMRGAVDLALCAEADIGVLDAEARGYDDSRKSSLFWLDWGASARGALSLGTRAFVDVSVAMLAPSAHSRRPFELASGALVSRAPVVGVLAGAGVGLRF